MKIKFGMELDAGCWPEFESLQQAVVGEVILGPLGFLGVLETTLGLVLMDEPEALRIRRYMERIQSLPPSSRFYSRSMEADAWATARELLKWRDELVLNGWDGSIVDGPERITALAEIEQSEHPLPDGLSDRFQHVLKKLENKPSVPIAGVLLQEPFELLPLPWQRLFEQLRSCGVTIEVNQATPSQLQEIVLLESEHSWPLAQTATSWISGFENQNDAVFLCQHGTGELDQAFHGSGLPATGQVKKSAQLGLFQLLPLLLENLWKPVRIDRLMELLSVPLSPVPGFAARELISAIAREPGLESLKWRKALENIRDKKRSYLIEDGVSEQDAAKQAETFANDLDHWLHISRVDAESLAPTAGIVSCIQRLTEHLAKQAATVSAAKIAMGHCRDMIKVLDGLDTISKPLLERIVDDVIGPGRASGQLREAASWGVFSNPGQLIAPVDTLLWWGFTDQSSASAVIWSNEELTWLAEQNINLDQPNLARKRERFYWQTLIQNCQRLLLFRPLTLDGAVVPVHPIWFEIEADERLKATVHRKSALDLLNQSNPQIMGVKLNLNPVQSRTSKRVFPVKSMDEYPDFKVEKLSPSSLDTLFGCNFKWLLENLGIEASDMMSFPEELAMIGTLAHQVLEDVLTRPENQLASTPPADAEKRYAIPKSSDASATAAEQFEIRVPEMAAELLLPENMSEYESIKKRVVDAADDFCRRLADAGFQSVSCEEWIHTSLDGIPVNGRADVIAYDADDKAHIIDFKYSYSNFYREKIKKGRDVQLITYSRMLGKDQSPVAYYMVPKRELVTNSPVFKVETVEADTSTADGWARVRKTVSSSLQQIRKGQVIAQGLLSDDELKDREDEIDENGEIYLSPPCRFCDFMALCGVNADDSAEEVDE